VPEHHFPVNAVSIFLTCAEVKFPGGQVTVISRPCDQELHFCVGARVGNGGCPGPTRHTELKRRARKSQSISPASRTSGWRRLMISSRKRAKQVGLAIVARLAHRSPPTANLAVEGITDHPNSGIPNRKKTGMHTRLSCKIDYLLRSNHRDRSIASSFFTDD
jgi:hypothetical protein